MKKHFSQYIVRADQVANAYKMTGALWHISLSELVEGEDMQIANSWAQVNHAPVGR